MMKTIKTAIILALCALPLLGGCKKADDIFQREQSEINVNCSAQTVRQNILVSGAWSSDCSEVQDWISLEPAEGVGDGKNFQYYYINIAYNKGEAREGTFYLIHNGKMIDVTVFQGKCDFSFGKPVFNGTLKQSEVCSAAISIPYTNAPAGSVHNVQVTMTGASEGLTVQNGEYTIETSGSGTLNIPVTGTPVNSGNLSFAVNLDGKDMGTLSTVVQEYVAPTPGGKEVTLAVWKFCDHQGTADDKAELISRHPEWWDSSLRVGNSGICYSDEGKGVLTVQEAAGKTATAINSWGGGEGHLYIKGFYVDDYWLFTVSDATLAKGDVITFSGSVGGSGSSAGYYLCEYSADGTSWTEAPGAATETIGSETIKYHAAAKDDITGTEQGAFNVSFPLTFATTGKLYLRLRVSCNVRVSHSSTVTITTGGGGSSRFKGNITIKAKTNQGGGGELSGLPVGWNFYALGMSATEVAASEYNYSWSYGIDNDNDSRHPCGAAQPTSNHKVMATSGNAAAWMSAYGANVSAYTFNPSIQCKGFGEGDGFIMTIPVKNVTAATKVTVEAGVGAAKAATGNWILEYSSNGTNWFEAPGKKTVTRGETSFECHLYNTSNSISPTRKTYDKSTDDTYQKYTFPLTGISDITDGNLYFRLRALIWNNNQTAPAANTGGWTDVKGFEVSVAE